MTPSVTAYEWFKQRDEEIALNYCLTWVRGQTPEDLLRRLGARNWTALLGVSQLYEPAAEAAADGGCLVAVVALPDWTLMVEPNGVLGSLDEVAVDLSAGTSLVSCFANENVGARFVWASDGRLELAFDPNWPAEREGRRPDALLHEMDALGFAGPGEDEAGEVRALALAEQVTGIRLTPSILDGATFLCAVVARPGRPDPDPISSEGDERFRGRVPNSRLLAMQAPSGGFLERLDLDLVFALSEAGDAEQRAVACWAALRAADEAGLTAVPQLAPAISALRRGEPVPPPFDDTVTYLAHPTPIAPVMVRVPPDGYEQVRHEWAEEALVWTAAPDSLTAAYEAVRAAVGTFGLDGYRPFLTALKREFPALG